MYYVGARFMSSGENYPIINFSSVMFLLLDTTKWVFLLFYASLSDLFPFANFSIHDKQIYKEFMDVNMVNFVGVICLEENR